MGIGLQQLASEPDLAWRKSVCRQIEVKDGRKGIPGQENVRSKGEEARKLQASSVRVKRMGLRADQTGNAAQGSTAESLD